MRAGGAGIRVQGFVLGRKCAKLTLYRALSNCFRAIISPTSEVQVEARA